MWLGRGRLSNLTVFLYATDTEEGAFRMGMGQWGGEGRN